MNGVCRRGQEYCLGIDTGVYSLEAVKKAAYRFADRACIVIQPKAGTAIDVAFSFGGGLAKNDPEQVIAEFCTELLDQDLREIIRRETTGVRNLILAHAFSRTSLVEQG